MNRFSFFILALFFIPFSLEGYAFLRNLSAGDTGSDVRELQVVLNADSRTHLALSGPGSSGEETDYFGFLTLKAVIAFQEKYRNEVLLPAGVVKPTGIIGHYSRMKLSALSRNVAPQLPVQETEENPSLSELPVPALPVDTSSVSSGPNIVAIEKSKIISLSRSKANRGSSVVAYGTFFHPLENTIHFSDSSVEVKNVSSPDRYALAFTIPDNLPDGTYRLWVSNGYGNSDGDLEVSITINDAKDTPPTITSVEPNSVSLKEDPIITITGTDFEEENILFSSFGTLKGVRSTDGKTLKFRISDFPISSQVKEAFANTQRQISLPVFLGISTSVGVSNSDEVIQLYP